MISETGAYWDAADDGAVTKLAEQKWELDYRQDFGCERTHIADLLKGRDPSDCVPTPEFEKLLNPDNFDLLTIREQKRNLTALRLGRMTGWDVARCEQTAEKFVTMYGRLMQEVRTGFLQDPTEVRVSIDGVTMPIKVEKPDETGVFRFGSR